ncbi:hypothetical protein CEE69_21390 [Rhodopirellula bahusiensis]|uniref:Uncharacterized protein n=1 Tax=Rhodopirellula bahusiensis TaxID=2014065 RepID=A0A2G1W2M7_9BACT|nr:hypothetical protein CEE69_21390 [Rhodopirellula bahusiensis]
MTSFYRTDGAIFSHFSFHGCGPRSGEPAGGRSEILEQIHSFFQKSIRIGVVTCPIRFVTSLP